MVEVARDVSARVEEAVMLLTTAMRNATFYGLGHKVTRECLERCSATLNTVLGEVGEITVAIKPDHLVFEGMPLRDLVGSLVPLAEEMHARDVGKFTLLPGLEQEELEALIDALITDEKALEFQGGVKHSLARQRVTHVLTEPSKPEEQDEEERRKQALQIHREAVQTIQKAMSAVEHGEQIDTYSVRTSVEDMLHMLLDDGHALMSLAAIKSYDEYLYEHSVNVAIVCMVFGHTLGLSEPQLADLGMAGMLHDLGKVFVPLEIVRKPGPLTEEEWLVMHSHPLIGARVLGTTKGVPEVCAVTAFEHHVRHDRSGYPKLSRNRPLHLFTSMMSIVDTYDSLTTVRPYRAPVRPDQALGWMLYCGANQFEPRLLARFASLLCMYPVGSLVRLDSAEWGLVTGGSPSDLARPVVRLLVDETGQLVRGNRQVDLANRDSTGNYTHGITNILQPLCRIAEITSTLNR